MDLQDFCHIAYRFSLPDGSRKEFDLDPRTIALRVVISEALPPWTLLKHEQCSCCPLDSSRDDSPGDERRRRDA